MRQEEYSYLPIGRETDIAAEMSSVRKFLKEWFEKNPHVAMAHVSKDILHRNHAYIQQYIEKGSPKVLSEETRKALASIIGCDEDALRETASGRLAEQGRKVLTNVAVPSASGPTGGPRQDRTLPVYGRAQAGNYEVSIITTDDRPVDWTHKPPQLEGVEGAYGTFVYGDSMTPAYDDGDVALVHPHRPLKAGKGVHIVLHNDDAFIKLFVKRTDTYLVVRQFNPQKEFQIPIKDIRYSYRIVGKWDG